MNDPSELWSAAANFLNLLHKAGAYDLEVTIKIPAEQFDKLQKAEPEFIKDKALRFKLVKRKKSYKPKPVKSYLDRAVEERFMRAPGEPNIYFDRAGNPISAAQYEKLRKDDDYKILKHDQIGPCLVSTAWIGLDFGNEAHEIFETAILDADYHENYREGYSTEQEALAGHAKAIEIAKEMVEEPKGDA